MQISKIKDKKYLAKGKRGVIYTGILKGEKVSIKKKNPDSEAIDRIKNEAKFLKILNKYDIGPKVIESGKDYIIYIYVEGDFLPEFLKKEKSELKKKKILISILKKARILDKLKINKLEFTRPLKHIFVKYPKVKMIDFERSYYTKNPKNVTQFCQFLIRGKYIKNNLKVFKNYKENQTEKNFKEILKLIK
ncbi:serine/threonine protein kinase [Candidatus Woesearchaeota archaeon]|nr:serine/threonine protein kinase [Candidatus Woesearchaeota archaeon]MBT4322354.1 serine/threonine protein kinase [Candidatus Woesearchaeota archaeon]MBT4630727.1 serine/threonine protein kinase [Candidatus Woesearchaeota archaeon]